MPQDNEPNNALERFYGISPENSEQTRKAEQLLQELINSEAVITLVAKGDAPERVKIKHERDVADDADVYTREVDKPIENELGWMLPVEKDGRTGFVVITPDFTTSAHFIRDTVRQTFENNYRDSFSPGRRYNVMDKDRIHTDGVSFHYEDRPARLVPTNPDHREQISEYLGLALSQAREKVVRGIEAEKNNRASTLNTFSDFLDGLRKKNPEE